MDKLPRLKHEKHKCGLSHPVLKISCTVRHALDVPAEKRLHSAFDASAMKVRIWNDKTRR